MAWSDDMRCLFCDGKLPLYRKITSGQFCSSSHRRAYWKEQERLAVERLSQTHDSLRAYRPPDADAIIGGAAAAHPLSQTSYLARPEPIRPVQDEVLDFARSASNRDEVGLSGFMRGRLPDASRWNSAGTLKASGPLTFAAGEPELIPASALAPVSPFDIDFETPLAGNINLAASAVPADHAAERPAQSPIQPLMHAPAPVLQEAAIAPEEPRELRMTFAEAEPEPVAEISSADAPVEAAIHSTPASIESPASPASIVFAEPAAEETIPAPMASFEIPAIAARPLTESIATPAPHDFSQAAVEMPAMQRELPAPRMADPVRLEKSGIPSFEFTLSPCEAAPAEHKPASPAFAGLAMKAAAGTLVSGQMVAPVMPRGSNAAPVQSSVSAIASEAAAVEASGLATPMATAQLALANAARYPLEGSAVLPSTNVVAPAETAAVPPAIVKLGLPVVSPIQEPSRGWLKRLHVKIMAAAPGDPQAFTASLAPVFPNGAEPAKPRHRFEPAEGSVTPPPPRSFLAFANWAPGNPSEGRNAWEHVADFWNHAPRDLKLLLFAIPVLLGLALHPRLPKVHVTAPATSAGLQKGFQQAVVEKLNVVEQNVANRAGVAFAEDFRSGLEDWQTRGDTGGWSFDANGFVRPGALALYRPSMRLSDYDFQFLGLIDKKALSFVARAQDFENYYVIKVVVVKPGPMPTIGITRYAVIHGKAQNRVDTIAPINALADSLYRVELNVHDDTFLLMLQGRVADTWSEARLPRGGVGFFAPAGEASRVRWVELTHQYDMLGRLCAYLAPYNIPTTNGSY